MVYRLFRPVWIPGRARNDAVEVGWWFIGYSVRSGFRVEPGMTWVCGIRAGPWPLQTGRARNDVGLWAGSMLLLLLRGAYAPSLSLCRPTGLKQSKFHSGMSHNKLQTRATILTPPLPHLIHIPFTSRLVPARQTGT